MSRRGRNGDPGREDDWRDIADDDAWDDLPGERRPWRRAREAERDKPVADDRTDEDWDEDDWSDEDEDWDEDDAEEGPEPPTGWRDPEPRKRRSVLTSLVLLPFRIVFVWPFKLLFWATAISLAWVAAYKVIDPPFWTYLDRERSRLGEVTKIWKDIDEISPNLVRAVIAAEDARFCEHWGIDAEATEEAVRDYLAGRPGRGGSTLTQQTAKNVFLWHDRSVVRKALEVPFSVAMEWIWGKERIVEVYLNVAEFDEGTFGAEAAARGYFSKRAADLTLTEASRLAAILPDPKDRSAARPGDYTVRRARQIAEGARTIEANGGDDCVLGK